MSAIWSPREGEPEAIRHWNSIRAHPAFGTAWQNIKAEPTCAERLATANKRIAELERQGEKMSDFVAFMLVIGCPAIAWLIGLHAGYCEGLKERGEDSSSSPQAS